MKKLLFCLIVFNLGLGLQNYAQVQAKLEEETNQKIQSRVLILATGGTIAGKGESETEAGYTAGEVPVDDLLEAVPEMDSVAEVTGEQIAQIGSQDMDTKTWLKLSKRINEVFENDEADAVVITHGTDTMEETAYFLSLTVASDKPVVLVGAMRPATALSQDGNRNLLDAVTVASSSTSKDIGVVTVMNQKIHAARDVDKTSTTDVAAFQSKNFGPMGLVFDGQVHYYYKPLRATDYNFDVRALEGLPQVDIIYGYAGAEPDKVDYAVEQGAQGIVYAGVGNGNFSKDVEKALAKSVEDGVVVCRSSRIGSGRVTLNNEVDDDKLGFLVSDDLNPQKARVLLMLALTQTDDRSELQNMFFRF